MARKHFDTLLSRVGDAIGVGNLEADADGYCLLRVDGQLELSIEFDEDSQSVILSAACGQLSATASSQILLELLSANFYWSGAGGSTLSVHGPTRTVYLQYRETIDHLDAPRLQDLLHAMLMNSETWSERLTALASGQAAPGAAVPMPVDPPPWGGIRV
ncbi:MAG TPA: type III secretion system chaperone [Candidatus Competibacteraceae bacterium]|nr:MAG: hypothetical protein EKK71_05610 [Candidatus Competibacteraceae bacterium]HOB61168.1 type III secretion system chaperone [Candidatus Competibacteraceae bacterium]HQA24755.1 type III secretion system chaperone [Candidatus Competibacteraceae bacterium]HQD55491.1 type III secretion system chaperone [Candidatus Competibacteraceae bacterium]